MKAYSQILLTILALALGGAVVVAALFIGAYYYVTPGLPAAAELRDIKIQVPLQVYSRDGRLIDEFGEMKRTPVAYDGHPAAARQEPCWLPRTSISSSTPASTIAASSAVRSTSYARAMTTSAAARSLSR